MLRTTFCTTQWYEQSSCHAPTSLCYDTLPDKEKKKKKKPMHCAVLRNMLAVFKHLVTLSGAGNHTRPSHAASAKIGGIPFHGSLPFITRLSSSLLFFAVGKLLSIVCHTDFLILHKSCLSHHQAVDKMQQWKELAITRQILKYAMSAAAKMCTRQTRQ